MDTQGGEKCPYRRCLVAAVLIFIIFICRLRGFLLMFVDDRDNKSKLWIKNTSD